eukprot:10386454-Karenia_brevis.AAC.1
MVMMMMVVMMVMMMIMMMIMMMVVIMMMMFTLFIIIISIIMEVPAGHAAIVPCTRQKVFEILKGFKRLDRAVEMGLEGFWK